MNLQNTLFTTTETDKVSERAKVTWQKLARYAIFAGLGLIGGAIGVALTFALAIAVQWLVFPASVFSPVPVFFAGVAILSGLAASWLLGWATNGIFTSSDDLDQQELQVMFVFSVLISLLESFIFIQV
ncbi:MAG: hypothetical protein JXM69_08060 [Anaerolineae bacterium]|nr:hypothetical protein [Anaerolineae bacterium]